MLAAVPSVSAAAAAAAAAQASAHAGFGSSSHAIIFAIDGLAVSTLSAALTSSHAPTLSMLRRTGAFSDDARVTQPSASFTNWASTLFAAPPAFHGVHGQHDFDGVVRPATYPAGTIWPNIFSAARQKQRGMSTAAYVSWPPLMKLLHPSDALNFSVLRTCRNCEECVDVEPKLLEEYATALEQHRFNLSWVYIDVLDECGHRHGTHWPGYLRLIRTVDAWLARVLRAVDAAGMRQSTTILVMSDHGREAREGRSHGGFTTAEVRVQWLLHGPAVRRGARLSWPISIMDSAPTLLHVLGVQPPVQMYGRVVREAFEGGDVGWHASRLERHKRARVRETPDGVADGFTFARGVAFGVALCLTTSLAIVFTLALCSSVCLRCR